MFGWRGTSKCFDLEQQERAVIVEVSTSVKPKCQVWVQLLVIDTHMIRCNWPGQCNVLFNNVSSCTV
jgi:hypothetical protein